VPTIPSIVQVSAGKDAGKYTVFNPTGTKELGTFDTKAQAEAFTEELMQAGPLTNTTNVNGFERLDNIDLQRNGAASTTTDAKIANGWGSNASRVVLRMEVPRTAVVSVPAYGQNVFKEHEVVVAGTAWKSWEAWRTTAPTFDKVAMMPARKFPRRAAKPEPIVIDLLDIDMKAGKSWLEIEHPKAADQRDTIRRKNREKHLAEQKAKRLQAKAKK